MRQLCVRTWACYFSSKLPNLNRHHSIEELICYLSIHLQNLRENYFNVSRKKYKKVLQKQQKCSCDCYVDGDGVYVMELYNYQELCYLIQIRRRLHRGRADGRRCSRLVKCRKPFRGNYVDRMDSDKLIKMRFRRKVSKLKTFKSTSEKIDE